MDEKTGGYNRTVCVLIPSYCSFFFHTCFCFAALAGERRDGEDSKN